MEVITDVDNLKALKVSSKERKQYKVNKKREAFNNAKRFRDVQV